MIRKRLILSLTLLITLTICSHAQEPVTNRPSPVAIISMRYKDAYVKVTYSRPSKRGREIFGKLVPYGQVWRTGANEATEITLTHNIQIQGTLLKAGTYSLFTIPEKDSWTIIINNELGLWGSYNYNSKLDQMRIVVPVQIMADEFYEQFTIRFDQRNDVADLVMAWDNVRISIPIKFIN
jgi:Protein of unknown function (DUF2911)